MPAYLPIDLASDVELRNDRFPGTFLAMPGREEGGTHMETVLVVDDVACVLDLLRRILLMDGYSVLAFV